VLLPAAEALRSAMAALLDTHEIIMASNSIQSNDRTAMPSGAPTTLNATRRATNANTATPLMETATRAALSDASDGKRWQRRIRNAPSWKFPPPACTRTPARDGRSAKELSRAAGGFDQE
jgi:hypothetical protein